MPDITIIGGGPAGSKCADLLKEYDVRVIEEHGVSGLPVQCTGLISDEVIRLSGVKVDVLNSLYGANVHFPDGTKVTARSRERKGVLIDRARLDTYMAEKAQDSGSEYHYNTKYLGHTVKNGNAVISTTEGEHTSKLIIGADGHGSAVSRTIRNNDAREYVRGIQVDLMHRTDDDEMIDILVGSEYAPGFFAWVIPFDDKVRVGLCSSYNSPPPSEYLKSVLKRTGLQDCKVIGKHSGRIPLGGIRRSYGDNMMLIGDAAGQVKPVSGGGLYPAFVSSYCLKDTADEAFDSGDMSSQFLRRYERGWNASVGGELRKGYGLRKIYRKMDDRCLNDVSCMFRREDVMGILDTIDIDSPSDLAGPILKRPRVAMKAIPLILRAMVGEAR